MNIREKSNYKSPVTGMRGVYLKEGCCGKKENSHVKVGEEAIDAAVLWPM